MKRFVLLGLIALVSYGQIPGGSVDCGPILKRVGKILPSLDSTAVEFPIDQIIPLHSIYRPEYPKPPNHIETLMERMTNSGYDQKFAIALIQMPDGKVINGGGHHRVEAMKRLNQKTIPARLYRWDSLSTITKDFYLSQFPEVIRPHLRTAP